MAGVKPMDTVPVWAVRVRRVGSDQAQAYARTNAFTVGAPASLKPADPHPSAIEYVLGALGGDLVNGFTALAARQGIAVHDAELSLNDRLDNALVQLGVVGETGHPGLAEITGTFYVSADADESRLSEIWQTALDRSPIFHTLSRSAQVTLKLRVAP